MARTNRKRRENKRKYETILEAERIVDCKSRHAVERMQVSGFLGYKDPTAIGAILRFTKR